MIQALLTLLTTKLNYITFLQHRYMENNEYNLSEIPCQHCGRRIIRSNYLLHQARCQIMSSRARKQEQTKAPLQPKPKIEENQPKPNQFIKPRHSNVQRTKIFNESKKRQDQQRIPCSFCSYPQTFAELDTHPKQCQFKGQNCTYCGQSFPQSLMDQHQSVCSARIPPTHFQQEQEQHRYPHHHSYYSQDQQSDQEDRHIHPFGNFRNFFYNNRHVPQLSPLPMYRRTQNINGTTIIEQSDGMGGIRRQIINNGARGIDPQFPQMRRGNLMFGGRRSSGSPFADFFRILEQMARGSGQIQQGLTKQQLKNLAKIKYKPSNSTSKEEKDLCTICYCEFQMDERIVKLKCNHMYHQECIVKWLQKNAKCPVCKAPQTNRQMPHQE